MALRGGNAAPVIRSCMDDNENWAPIYGRLSDLIGEPHAWSWFSPCHFVGLDGERLTLAHWNGFSAKESLRRHGEHLAKAAGVKEIRMYRHGGYLPHSIVNEPRKAEGYDLFVVGSLKAPSAAVRRA